MQPWLYAALRYFVMNDFTVQTEVFTCVIDSSQSQKKIPSATPFFWGSVLLLFMANSESLGGGGTSFLLPSPDTKA